MIGILILFCFAGGIITVVGTTALIHSLRHPWRRGYSWAVANRLPTNPEEMGWAYEERTVQIPHGETTIVWLVEGDDPTGPCIVVSHSFRDSRFGAMLYLPALAPVASRVIVYDVRAHGESTANVSALSTAEADDLLDLLSQLDVEGPLVMFGASMGATISMAAASRLRTDPTRAGAVSLVGLILEGAYVKPADPIYGYFRERRYPVYPFVPLADWHFAFWLPGYRTWNAADRIAELDLPVLLLHGEQDGTTPVAGARQLADAASDATLEVFEDATHLDLAWRDPKRYADAVRAFIDRLGPFDHAPHDAENSHAVPAQPKADD